MWVVWSHPFYKVFPAECYCGFENGEEAAAFQYAMHRLDPSVAWHHPILIP